MSFIKRKSRKTAVYDPQALQSDAYIVPTDRTIPEPPERKPKRNAILIQQAVGPHVAMLDLTEETHRAYCEKHGFDYRVWHSKESYGKPPHWAKVGMLREALAEGYECVVWLDADTLIIDHEADLRRACPKGGGIGCTWHDLIAKGFPPPCYDHFNTGAFYVRNSPEVREFVDRWWDTPDDDHPWHEQHSFNKVGALPGPHMVWEIDLKWNSTPPFYESPNPVVKAWHGFGNTAQRLRAMQQAMGIPITPNDEVSDIPRADGLGTERHKWLLYGLVRWLQPQTVVEVGAWRGNTSIALAKALKDNGRGQLVCIDDFSLEVGTLEILVDNLDKAGVADVVSIANGKSTEVEWPFPVDLAFIDGDHSYQGCKADVEKAIQCGAKCIVLHDTSGWWGPRKFIETSIPLGWSLVSVDFDGGLGVLMEVPIKSPVVFTEEEHPSGAVDVLLPVSRPDEFYMEAKRAVQDGDFRRAERFFQMALSGDRDEPNILIEFADMYARTKRHEEAASVLQLCVSYDPNNGDAWRQLGAAYTYLGMHEEAGPASRRAVELAPGNAAAHWNYALWLLADGQYEKGWEEFRWGCINGVGRRVRTLKPEWDGKPIPGKTLFVWAEDGLGDTIMFSRFLPAIKELSGADIFFEVQPQLVALYHTFDGTDLVFKQSRDGSIPIRWDEHVSLLSLPRLLGITPENLPGEPYISAAPEQIDGGELKIGICRAGSASHANDFQRSIPVSEMTPFRDIEGVKILTLHPEEGSGLGDMTDTAKRIAACDLVITVDTAVAHLAGAMGTPVWILLSKSSDWRWMIDREDTPWYPNARLFRQTQRGDWRSVIDRVIGEVRSLTEALKAA